MYIVRYRISTINHGNFYESANMRPQVLVWLAEESLNAEGVLRLCEPGATGRILSQERENIMERSLSSRQGQGLNGTMAVIGTE